MIPSGPTSFMRRVGNYTPGHVTHSQSGCTSSIVCPPTHLIKPIGFIVTKSVTGKKPIGSLAQFLSNF